MPNFKSKKEWFDEAKRLRATGLSAPEIAKKLGTFQVEGKTYAIHNKGADGVTSVDMEGRKARGNRRNLAIKEQDTKLLETLKLGGMSETESQSVLKKEKAGYKRIEHQASELNKVHGKGAFNAGHETAALEGGGNYGRNARVEIGKSRIKEDGTRLRGNQSRGRLDETRNSVKSAMGIPRSHRGGKDTALFNLLEKDVPGIMNLGLTPKDRQDIKRTKTNAQADDIIANRQLRIKSNNGRRSSTSGRTMRPTSRVPKAEAGFVAMPEIKLPSKQQILQTASHFVPGPSKQAITALASGPVQQDTRSTGLKVVDTLTSGLEPIKSLVRQANPQLDEEKDLQQTTTEIQKFLKNPLNELKWGLKILQSGM